VPSVEGVSVYDLKKNIILFYLAQVLNFNWFSSVLFSYLIFVTEI